MNSKNYKKINLVIGIVLLCFVSFATGIYAAPAKNALLNGATQISDKNVDLSLLFNVWNILKEKSIHYDENVDQDKVYGAIAGLTASLGDPYTEFMPPKEAKSFTESITGSFEGIGAEIGIKDSVLTIIAPLKNSPAQKAGLKSGDMVLKINDVVTTDLSVNEAITRIRGKKGTNVVLDIYREGAKDTQKITVVRDTIVVPTTESETISGVFVIHVYNFGNNVTADFVKDLDNFQKSGLNYLVIDLRGNPGGYLESAVDIASYFIPEGKTVVSEDFVKQNKKSVHMSYGYNKLKVMPKVVVLVDAGSASASEILAGALHDNGIAKIVGVKTYGKGSVQELINMKGGTSLKVTVARWLTPKGITIDKNGIAPDVEVKKVEDVKNPKKDNQLEKAIEVVKNS